MVFTSPGSGVRPRSPEAGLVPRCLSVLGLDVAELDGRRACPRREVVEEQVPGPVPVLESGSDAGPKALLVLPFAPLDDRHDLFRALLDGLVHAPVRVFLPIRVPLSVHMALLGFGCWPTSLGTGAAVG